jgi:hypothetical protein
MLSVVVLSPVMLNHAPLHSLIMRSVIILSLIMLNVIMLNVVLVNVVAPSADLRFGHPVVPIVFRKKYSGAYTLEYFKICTLCFIIKSLAFPAIFTLV